jgi:hypothetical protein
MTDENNVYVRVEDQSGNDFFCPMESLADPEKATEDELENCVEDAVVERYPGNIEIMG